MLYILRPTIVNEDNDNKTNYLTVIFEKLMESKKLIKLFEGSIHNSAKILPIDTLNGMVIKDLTDAFYKDKAIAHLG